MPEFWPKCQKYFLFFLVVLSKDIVMQQLENAYHSIYLTIFFFLMGKLKSRKVTNGITKAADRFKLILLYEGFWNSQQSDRMLESESNLCNLKLLKFSTFNAFWKTLWSWQSQMKRSNKHSENDILEIDNSRILHCFN